jgi:NAD(P)-dependent dehydrogenase (short-subunit alcohol dehydrogenase family)
VIINTASVSGLTAWSHAGAYCASKAAVISLTKVGAVEYAREGIRVNCVCPGAFRTRIQDGLSGEAMEQMAARHPIGRFAQVKEVAGAYVYLASDDATFVTGAALVVDGGYTAP